MNTQLIILIAAVVVVLLLIAFVIIGLRRHSAKKISFENEQPKKELTQQEKSGNYQAQGGFNFSSAQKEPVELAQSEPEVRQAESAEPVIAAESTNKPEELIDAHATKLDSQTHEQGAQIHDVESSDSDSAADTVSEDGVSDSPDSADTTDSVDSADSAPVEDIDPADGRIARLRARLSRSQNVFGRSVLGMLSEGDLDDEAWEDIEALLLQADLGANVTLKVVDQLRETIAKRGVSSEQEAREMLRECLISAAQPDMDRSIKAMPYDGKPAVILVVGVNGTGKTTTTGKLARVLVSMGHSVLLGAADTFRAAAADQLETWGRRVGARTVRGKEGADPASVAFDAVSQGVESGVDVVLIDTAGRLHNSANLMDQLGKVKRVVEKKAKVDEVLLVLDATTGQNGMHQAKVFSDVVEITGVALTKLDGTAKGGIVFRVQEELGVPVKLVGLGEGADHLAPFEVDGFVDALLGTQ
ncbi:signal recognition particle-docking protein FtsY [Corynebacterium sp. sy017]|uniref:signal recognition particle-docking protein FtsY n=1 Tax=unclassified Corynebacterium TaxID=2624378 RepID=UPI001185039E|nr:MULTISPECIES: signal recognition particle-docking protein FtsY [unclassified Corynebacterium]MBP3087877.1 signal recognition particle-docking protein FtsY [Corynebacterium sp. sy017]TSD92418.1 signal recognition particle-docking protein FtsY [Corynebacterium sp. SY003]